MSCPDILTTNFLSPTGFQFFIKRTPNVNFFVQKINIPGISLLSPESGNPFVGINYPGDHILYNELHVTFKVDENLTNYMEIHDWMRQNGFPSRFEESLEVVNKPKSLGLTVTSEATILVLNSSKNAILSCQIREAMPVMLSDLNFDTTDPSIDYISAEAVFKYTSYHLEKVV